MCSLRSFSALFFRQYHATELELTMLAQLPGQQAPRVLRPPSPNARLRGPGFYGGTQDPNSDPHVSFVSILPMELRPQALPVCTERRTHLLHWVCRVISRHASQKYLSVYTFYICYSWYHSSVSFAPFLQGQLVCHKEGFSPSGLS